MTSSKEPRAPGKMICPESSMSERSPSEMPRAKGVPKASVFPSEDSHSLCLGLIISKRRARGWLLVRNETVGAEDEVGSVRARGQGHGTGDRKRATGRRCVWTLRPTSLGSPSPSSALASRRHRASGVGRAGVDSDRTSTASPPRVSRQA